MHLQKWIWLWSALYRCVRIHPIDKAIEFLALMEGIKICSGSEGAVVCAEDQVRRDVRTALQREPKSFDAVVDVHTI